jgi:c(7)-type cytochrome triheme protein
MFSKSILTMKGGETKMKKYFVFVLVVVVTFAMAVSAFAVQAGKTVEFTPKGADKVVFDGKIHADKGLKCADCHPGVFKMKKGGDVITMKDINEGKFCGSCHNGTKAFGAKDAATCVKCHVKK